MNGPSDFPGFVWAEVVTFQERKIGANGEETWGSEHEGIRVSGDEVSEGDASAPLISTILSHGLRPLVRKDDENLRHVANPIPCLVTSQFVDDTRAAAKVDQTYQKHRLYVSETIARAKNRT